MSKKILFLISFSFLVIIFAGTNALAAVERLERPERPEREVRVVSNKAEETIQAVSLGCVVVFLAPDTVQYFFEKFLSCPYPFLPQIEKKAAFAVLKYCEVDDVFMASQRYPDEILANARNNFSLPEGFAVDNVINAVNNL